MNWPTRLLTLRTSTALLLTSALFSLGSCEDANEIGVDLPGAVPVGAEFVEFPVSASTLRQDSVLTARRDHYLVGRLTDTNTGALIEARSFLELIPTGVISRDTLPARFPGARLDSLVLLAGFDRVYGRATQPVRFNVYNTSSPLDERISYNSTSSLPLANAVAENVEGSLNKVIRNVANTRDSVQLPLRLVLSGPQPTPFAADLFSLLNTTASTNITQQQLQTKWKALALTPAANFDGTIVGFSNSSVSQIIVHYSTGSGTSLKKRTYRILFNSPTGSVAEPRYFTNISYDLSNAGAPFNALQTPVIAEVPAASSNDVTYAQEGTGLVTKLVIPGLATLRTRQQQENIVINRAELVVPLRNSLIGNILFPPPPALFLYEAGTNNRVLQFLNGVTPTERIVQADNASARGADSDAALRLRSDERAYSALLTTYVQAYVTDQLRGPAPAALLLSPTLRRLNRLSLDRVAIDAQNIRLRVYYTKPAPR